MGTIKKQNKTTIIRCPKDTDYPFVRIPAALFKLDVYQFAIMAHIISNSNDWNIVKYEIGKRIGLPERKFLKAWKELETLGYIQLKRMWGCYHYTICEDPDYTTGTGADCIDHTTGNSTGCTGAILTTINNNYYKDVTTTGGSICDESQFNELLELYPSKGSKPDGTTYPLKGKQAECKKAYSEYLKTGVMNHDEILTALRVELNEKNGTGDIHFQKGLFGWINDKIFEQYRGKSLEPVNMGYGTDLI